MDPETPTPLPPADLGEAGLALWNELSESFDFETQEAVLLVEACRVKDRLDALDVVVRAEGVTISSPQGVKAHPGIVEGRHQQVVFSRLIASLRLPDEEDSKPQRRGRSRGTYGAGDRKYGGRN